MSNIVRVTRKKLSSRDFVAEYKVDLNGVPLTQLPGKKTARLVRFFLWARTNASGVFFKIEELYKIIFSQYSEPSRDEVQGLQNVISNVRQKLQRKDHVQLLHEPGIGYRVCVDSDDIVSNALPVAMMRVESSMMNARRVRENVNPRELTTGNRVYFNAVGESVQKFLGVGEEQVAQLKRLQLAAKNGAPKLKS